MAVIKGMLEKAKYGDSKQTLYALNYIYTLYIDEVITREVKDELLAAVAEA